MNFELVYFLNNLSQTYPSVFKIASFVSGPISYILFPFFFLIYVVLKSKNHMYWFSLVFLSTFFAWFVAVILKHIFKIARPFVTHPNLIHSLFESGYSFPSEHAAIYGVFTFLAWEIDYKLGIFTTIVGIIVIFSRIFLGVHYPLDIFVGYVIGLTVAFLTVIFFKKYL